MFSHLTITTTITVAIIAQLRIVCTRMMQSGGYVRVNKLDIIESLGATTVLLVTGRPPAYERANMATTIQECKVCTGAF